jgi:hypothetical protein
MLAESCTSQASTTAVSINTMSFLHENKAFLSPYNFGKPTLYSITFHVIYSNDYRRLQVIRYHVSTEHFDGQL